MMTQGELIVIFIIRWLLFTLGLWLSSRFGLIGAMFAAVLFVLLSPRAGAM